MCVLEHCGQWTPTLMNLAATARTVGKILIFKASNLQAESSRRGGLHENQATTRDWTQTHTERPGTVHCGHLG